jgi:integrase
MKRFEVDAQHVQDGSDSRQDDGNPIHDYGQGGGASVRHSKEDALNEREFELLLEGAQLLSQSDYYYDADPEMTIYTLGRLGLRRSELAHLREDWIDFRQQMISIPSHEPCTLGRDSGPCGDCIQAAKQRVKFSDGELDIADALRWMWAPKTEAGAREVYFGHDTRAQMFLERYFNSDEYNRYQASGTAINRRVHKAAGLAPELDSAAVYPHALRATAATNMIATQDLDVYQLCQVMGWERLATAETYISRNSQKTARQLEGY